MGDCMGKKKKSKKTPKVRKGVSKVDEMQKSIANIDLPDDNPFKLENDNKIDRWRPMRSGRRLNLKEKKRELAKRKGKR
jgi:hypothetical protein